MANNKYRDTTDYALWAKERADNAEEIIDVEIVVEEDEEYSVESFELAEENEEPQEVSLSEKMEIIISKGGTQTATDEQIKELQAALKELGYYSGNESGFCARKSQVMTLNRLRDSNGGSLNTDSLRHKHLSETQQAIIQFQLNCPSLEASGFACAKTLKLIALELEKKNNSKESTTTPKKKASAITYSSKNMKISRPRKITSGSLENLENLRKSSNKNQAISSLQSSITKEQTESNLPLPSSGEPAKVRTMVARNSFDPSTASGYEYAERLRRLILNKRQISDQSSEKVSVYIDEALKIPGKIEEIQAIYRSFEGQKLEGTKVTSTGLILNDIRKVNAKSSVINYLRTLLKVPPTSFTARRNRKKSSTTRISV